MQTLKDDVNKPAYMEYENTFMYAGFYHIYVRCICEMVSVFGVNLYTAAGENGLRLCCARELPYLYDD